MMKRTREERSCEGLTRERSRLRVDVEDEEEMDPLAAPDDEEMQEEEEGVRVSRKPPPPVTFTTAARQHQDQVGVSTTAGRRRYVTDYAYVRISELKADVTANVYAVVLDLKEPRPSRGTGTGGQGMATPMTLMRQPRGRLGGVDHAGRCLRADQGRSA